ncbi:MAG: ribulose-phosphate 3-epimerase [Candidatus Omnitrophica bacterium]|nr:ribulose-phosphate 3-epimerase [Candidatus Omnitrophota bacterium]
MNKRIKAGPSILAADFSNLSVEIKRAEDAGVDFLHCDIMDGHFVPNITFGPAIIRDIRKHTKLILDVHLMIEKPRKFLEAFVKAGSDIITVHIETVERPIQLIKEIKELGLKAGISLNPRTPVKDIAPVLNMVDLVLVMTVNPGFGGQEFISSCLSKIKRIRRAFSGDIEVDGGINYKTAKMAVEAGANMLVAGTYLFGSDNMKGSVEKLKDIKV